MNKENKPKSDPLKIRCSDLNDFMSGGGGITEKQLEEIDELIAKRDAPVLLSEKQIEELAGLEHRFKHGGEEGVRPLTERQAEKRLELRDKFDHPKPAGLTDKQQERLDELIAKRDAPFELVQGTKTLIENYYLRREYGVEKPLITPQILKGIFCEQDAAALVTKQIPSKTFRIKNQDLFEDDDLRGVPDWLLKDDGVIEDTKVSWTVIEFFRAKLDPQYWAQGQGYLRLLRHIVDDKGEPIFKKFRLIYALVDTPAELVIEEEKRIFYKLGAPDEDNPLYQDALEKLHRLHYPSKYIPEEKRVKVFEFEYEPSYFEGLPERIDAARKYYDEQVL